MSQNSLARKFGQLSQISRGLQFYIFYDKPVRITLKESISSGLMDMDATNCHNGCGMFFWGLQRTIRDRSSPPAVYLIANSSIKK